ncbi:hypothetical protein AA309_20925 [Microvirga vignae]|uniref:Uncharacterized protein n=1 Tax=Microvirga vignae TaxID=1225564 RepID=A0A0H1R7Y2_9HYPH|nr:hypothetical protein AA309_20925 [Microvirga vignae]
MKHDALVLGTGFCFNDLTDGPLAGLGFHAALFLLGLFAFAVTMLFAVCHDRTSGASGGMMWSANHCQSILHLLRSGISGADVVSIGNHGLNLRATVERGTSCYRFMAGWTEIMLRL